jgi:putative glycosyltransferase
MKLSIVTPLYNSQDFIRSFHERIIRCAQAITADYELIFVNDGSCDSSLAIATTLQKGDPHVLVVDLSRNFGHHKALMTGLSYASGEFVFQIDVDLEEEPELLTDFWTKMAQNPDLDVVYGVQHTRKGGWFERVSGRLFYILYNRLASVPVPHNIVCARLMRRAYVDALLRFREQEIFLAGLWSAAGFNQRAMPMVKQDRGASNYSFRKKLSLLVNSITSFSTAPLKLIFGLGAGITGLSFVYIVFLVLRKIFLGAHIDGWTTIVVSIWFFGGLILFSIGIIGLYLSKIFIETKNRPYTLIKGVYGRKENK